MLTFHNSTHLTFNGFFLLFCKPWKSKVYPFICFCSWLLFRSFFFSILVSITVPLSLSMWIVEKSSLDICLHQFSNTIQFVWYKCLDVLAKFYFKFGIAMYWTSLQQWIRFDGDKHWLNGVKLRYAQNKYYVHSR